MVFHLLPLLAGRQQIRAGFPAKHGAAEPHRSANTPPLPKTSPHFFQLPLRHGTGELDVQARTTRHRRREQGGGQENACVLYSWICLNIDMYRRDKHRLYPSSTGRRQPSSPAYTHAHSLYHRYLRGYCSSTGSPPRHLPPCSRSCFDDDVVFVHTQYFTGFQDCQTTGNGAEQPKK